MLDLYSARKKKDKTDRKDNIIKYDDGIQFFHHFLIHYVVNCQLKINFHISKKAKNSSDVWNKFRFLNK